MLVLQDCILIAVQGAQLLLLSRHSRFNLLFFLFFLWNYIGLLRYPYFGLRELSSLRCYCCILHLLALRYCVRLRIVGCLRNEFAVNGKELAIYGFAEQLLSAWLRPPLSNLRRGSVNVARIVLVVQRLIGDGLIVVAETRKVFCGANFV